MCLICKPKMCIMKNVDGFFDLLSENGSKMVHRQKQKKKHVTWLACRLQLIFFMIEPIFLKVLMHVHPL